MQVLDYPVTSSLPSDTQVFSYDAMGRRITEDRTVTTTSSSFKGINHLYYNSAGNVIEEDLQPSRTNTAMTTEAQYVPSLAGGNMLVLEDDNTLGSTASNNFGKPYSGLDDRMWIQQGPDGSTWQIIHDTSGSGGITEQYLYTPQGQVTVIILSGGSYVAPNGNSQPTYSPSGFRYLFKGDRAEIYANESATSGTILSMFDGLYSTQSGEYDGYAGTPLGEDVQIYGTPNNISSDIYNPYVSEDVDDSGDGTSGQWIDPSTTLGWWGNFAEALPDAFADTVSSNAQAVGGVIQQFGYTLADLGNDLVYDTTFANSYIGNFGDLTQTNGMAFYSGHLSAIEQGIDSGAVNPLSWGYVGQSVYGAANAMSFGTLDEATATVQYAAGGLSTDQYGNRLAVGAFMNFVSAAALPPEANIAFGWATFGSEAFSGQLGGIATEAVPRILAEEHLANLTSALKASDPNAAVAYYSSRGNFAGIGSAGTRVAFAYPEYAVPAGVAFEEFQHAFDAIADPADFLKNTNIDAYDNFAYHADVFDRIAANPVFDEAGITAAERSAFSTQARLLRLKAIRP
jgi:hypothetical protein